MTDKVSVCSEDHFNVSTKVQLSGVLLKRPFGHHSNKWSRRFFLVKESFLLYYPESEKKAFEKRGTFNIHPKGVIPLGGCMVESVTDNTQQYAIHIRSDEFNNGCVALAAENQYERERWAQILQEAGRITWKNTQLGEALIRELETQGLQLCKERQNYFDRLQEETIALRDEIDKNEELERITAELAKERKRLEEMMVELKEEHGRIRREYEETIQDMKGVEKEKEDMQRNTLTLQITLEELAQERSKVMQALKQREEENCKLSQTSEELQNTLKMIEEETKMLLDEKTEIEQRYVENELRAQVLEEEKKLISEQADQLQASLQDLMSQKALTEAELKEEVVARMEAERRLRAAEGSLNHLERTLQRSSCNISDGLRAEILPDVKKLKKFFEDIAEEAKIDANKPFIMKNAVLARKMYAQKARTMRIKASRQEKARTLGIYFDSHEESGLRRTFSTIITSQHECQSRYPMRRTASTRIPLPMTQESWSPPVIDQTSPQCNGTTNSNCNLEDAINTVTIDGEVVSLRTAFGSVVED